MISPFGIFRNGAALVALIMAAILVAAPQVADQLVLLQLTFLASMVVFALSLGFVWGYGGILCFGQSAFFGLGAYAYAIALMNFGESTLPLLLGIATPALCAAVLGFFMFYGRLNDVYVAVITLAVTLALFYFVNSTSDNFYRIGNARLMGFNGISGIPPLNVPGQPEYLLDPTQIFYVSMCAVILTYLGLHWLLHSRFGRVVVATREHELRAELLGYDVRKYRLATFSIGGGLAGLAGILSINYTGFISPNTFNLAAAAQPIMWVLVGGLGTLVGPILGCIALLIVTFALGTAQLMNTYLIYGLVVMIFVVLIPQGIVPTILAWSVPIARLVRGSLSDIRAAVLPRANRSIARDLSAASAVPRQLFPSPDLSAAILSSNSEGNPILLCRDLRMQFGGVVALNGVDFSLEAGEIRCLIGPNGAGKSTFFKCLTRQNRPTSGQIFFEGQEITTRLTHEIAECGIAIKTQVPSLFDSLSVRENIWLSARRHNDSSRSDRAADEIIERLSIGSIAARPAGLLSHGQRQWVELAIVMSASPRLVLLDEPTAGMTHEEIAETAELIREINKTAALIVVEHDMQFVKSIARKVTVFHQGQIFVEDSVENVLTNRRVQEIYLGKGLG